MPRELARIPEDEAHKIVEQLREGLTRAESIAKKAQACYWVAESLSHIARLNLGAATRLGTGKRATIVSIEFGTELLPELTNHSGTPDVHAPPIPPSDPKEAERVRAAYLAHARFGVQCAKDMVAMFKEAEGYEMMIEPAELKAARDLGEAVARNEETPEDLRTEGMKQAARAAIALKQHKDRKKMQVQAMREAQEINPKGMSALMPDQDDERNYKFEREAS